MANNPYKPKKKKKFKIDTKNMGVNIDKNEYYEIILSNSAHSEELRTKLLFPFRVCIFFVEKYFIIFWGNPTIILNILVAF